MDPTEQRYQRLPTSNEPPWGLPDRPILENAPKRSRLIYLTLAAILGSLLILTGIAVVYWRTFSPEVKLAAVIRHDCGNSSAEAISKGCFFDVLGHMWQPSECRWEDGLSDEYRTFVHGEDRVRGAWPYFDDVEGTQRIEDETALSLRTTQIHTTHEAHKGHCVFLWRRWFWTVQNKGFIPRGMKEGVHSRHCDMTIMNNVDFGKMDSRFYINFGTC